MDWKWSEANNKPKYLGLWTLAVGFIGYAIGRLGSILWGHLDTLHHWVPAIVIILIAPIWRKNWWWVLLLSFGIGLLISDLDDFLNLRVWGVDVHEDQHFWGID